MRTWYWTERLLRPPLGSLEADILWLLAIRAAGDSLAAALHGDGSAVGLPTKSSIVTVHCLPPCWSSGYCHRYISCLLLSGITCPGKRKSSRIVFSNECCVKALNIFLEDWLVRKVVVVTCTNSIEN